MRFEYDSIVDQWHRDPEVAVISYGELMFTPSTGPARKIWATRDGGEVVTVHTVFGWSVYGIGLGVTNA